MSSVQSSTYVFPALGNLWERSRKHAYPLLRIGYGAWFIPHGVQKLFRLWGGGVEGTAKGMATAGIEPAMFWAYYIGWLEMLGGFLIVIGFLTRPVAALFVGFIFVAAFYFNTRFGYFWTKGGMEMPLLLLLVAVVILIQGGGEYSVDRRIGREI